MLAWNRRLGWRTDIVNNALLLTNVWKAGTESRIVNDAKGFAAEGQAVSVGSKIKFACVHCKKPLSVSAAGAGKTVACPNAECRGTITIPFPESTETPKNDDLRIIMGEPEQASRTAEPKIKGRHVVAAAVLMTVVASAFAIVLLNNKSNSLPEQKGWKTVKNLAGNEQNQGKKLLAAQTKTQVKTPPPTDKSSGDSKPSVSPLARPASPRDRPAPLVPSEPEGPILGKWKIVIEKNAVPQFSQDLFLIRRVGNRYDGYMDIAMPGSHPGLEIFSADFDPSSRSVRILGREVHSEFPEEFGAGCHRMEGRLEPNNRKLIVKPQNPEFTGYAEWVSGETNVGPPEILSELTQTNIRYRTYQQCSSDFALNKSWYIHGYDSYLSKELESANNPTVNQILDGWRNFSLQSDIQKEHLAVPEAERRRREAEVAIQLLGTITGAGDAGNNPLTSFRDFMESKTVKWAVEAEKINAETALHYAILLEYLRRTVRSDYESRGLGNLITKKNNFGISCLLPNKDKFGIKLVNSTYQTLHNCSIIINLKMDQEKIEFYHNQTKQRSDALVPLFFLAGIDQTQGQLGGQAMFAYNKIDKNTLIFVPYWEHGSSIVVEFIRPDTIMLGGESMSLWIGSDQGIADVPLALAPLRSFLKAQIPDIDRPPPGRVAFPAPSKSARKRPGR